ncbi:hypothetical protein CEXT_721881 [Caerostris extrusa]|uniref:Uncharacterized protein n=1 Tax=Caerostris extrusa TaxID=172846 RepID=A0AAV4R7M3_CAEEX|nr:hypothetical protein CEXT_721881 [Caerostris extrusa]
MRIGTKKKRTKSQPCQLIYGAEEKALSKEKPDHRGEQRPFSLCARKKQKLFLQTNPEGSPRIHLIYNSDFSRHFCPSPRRVIGPIEIQVASLSPTLLPASDRA